MRYPHFIVAASRVSINVLTYALSVGRRLHLEGRFRRGRYHNWSFDRSHRSAFHAPATEEEVVELVRTNEGVRVCGSGHSFNDGLRTTGINISLDHLNAISVDQESKTATIQAGARLRDVTRQLRRHGLAVRSLASHDAQSVAGILSSDVHGTGRGPAHLSDVTLAMRIVDGTGTVHKVEPDDDLFRAAVGGIGAVGIISEITVQCVEAFHLRQTTETVDLEDVKSNLARLQAEHDHISLYAYPFARVAHLHTWTRTDDRRSVLGPLREFLSHAGASLSAAWVADWMAHRKMLADRSDAILGLDPGSNLVLRSANAFNRTLYHLHQELEFAVPAAEVWDALEHCLDLYETLYPDRDLPFLLVEVRFSPQHHPTLLGAGGGRDSAWLCLCLNQSGDVGAYFDRVEDWLRTTDYRPHLGKWVERIGAGDLARLHGERYATFGRVRDRHDPDRRFANSFTERVLGP